MNVNSRDPAPVLSRGRSRAGNSPWKWNNGKEVLRLDLTSSTTSRQQIHKFDHTWTANPCDWLPCRPPIGRLSPLSCLFTSPSCWGTHFLYLSNPRLGTSFPLFHALHNITKQNREFKWMGKWGQCGKYPPLESCWRPLPWVEAGYDTAAVTRCWPHLCSVFILIR